MRLNQKRTARGKQRAGLVPSRGHVVATPKTAEEPRPKKRGRTKNNVLAGTMTAGGG
jgi:hypothetical protein